MFERLKHEFPFRPLLALDLLVLDCVYTPIAHWLHDEFAIRARSASLACLAGMAAGVALEDYLLGYFFLGCVAAMELQPSRRLPIGCVNCRRYSDQLKRIALLACVVLPPWEWGGVICFASAASVLYFAAVTERPRRERLAAAPVAA